MSTAISRRRFFQASLTSMSVAALSPSARAIDAFVRAGAPRLRLSLAAYSFRDDLKAPKGSPEGTQPKMTMTQFVDYCADHGCEGAELTSYYFPEPITDESLSKVRRHAHLRGITVSGSAVGNNFTHPAGPERDREVTSVKKWIDRAAILGAPHIRVFAGGAQKGQTRAEAVKNCVEALDECADYAGQHGIFLGIENHGGIVATPDELLEVIHLSKSPWVGINLDSGNFHTEDPYADLAKCAPFAVNVQYKGEIRRKGATTNEASDPARVAKILRDANYQGWVALEYEMKESAWTGVPTQLAKLKAVL